MTHSKFRGEETTRAPHDGCCLETKTCGAKYLDRAYFEGSHQLEVRLVTSHKKEARLSIILVWQCLWREARGGVAPRRHLPSGGITIEGLRNALRLAVLAEEKWPVERTQGWVHRQDRKSGESAGSPPVPSQASQAIVVADGCSAAFLCSSGIDVVNAEDDTNMRILPSHSLDTASQTAETGVG